MNRTFLRPLLRAVLTAGLAGTLLAAPAEAAAPTAPGAPVERPRAGQCHALTFEEGAASSDPDAPVSCDRVHTSRTFAVPSVPSGVDMRDLDALQRIVDNKCDPAYVGALNRSIKVRLMSAYTAFWFAPTQAEIRQGARWIRCDLALWGGTSLAPLPDAKKPALGRAPHPDAEAKCMMGKAQRYRFTVCKRAHAYRATKIFTMSGPAYPSERAQDRASIRNCAPVSRTRTWIYFSVTAEGWRNGLRHFTCADVTPR